MTFQFFSDKVKYKFFDKTFDTPYHYYAHKDPNNPPCPVEVVKDNSQKIAKEMEGDGLVILHQVHGKEVHIATTPTEYGLEPIADASVTNIPGLILGIQTADCIPILFACNTGKIIGAAHSGWQGSKMNIASEVIRTMRSIGAEEISAIIGPSIHQDSYEVSQPFYDDFVSEDETCAVFFKNGKESHYYFDLPSYVERKLNLAGVTEVLKHSDDTYTMKDKYYSWRRCCHEGVEYQGNLLSAIVIK